jgi:hypothetical protein
MPIAVDQQLCLAYVQIQNPRSFHLNYSLSFHTSLLVLCSRYYMASWIQVRPFVPSIRIFYHSLQLNFASINHASNSCCFLLFIWSVTDHSICGMMSINIFVRFNVTICHCSNQPPCTITICSLCLLCRMCIHAPWLKGVNPNLYDIKKWVSVPI